MIKLYSVVLKESPLDSPFVPKSKCGAEWVSSAIGATAQTIGDIIGWLNNNNSNETLERMNRENIEFQKQTNLENREENRYLLGREQAFSKQQLEAQNAFNLDMWEKNNSYNSPVNQVQRLLAAGINPASAFGQGGQSSPVSSVGGSSPSSHPSNAVAPQNTFAPQPYRPDLGGAVNAFNQSMLANASVKETEARAHNIDLSSDLLDKSLNEQVKHWQNVAKGSGISADLAKKQLDFIGATMDYDIKLRYGQTLEQDQALKNMQEQYRGMKLQNDILNITKSYADQLNRAQIAQIWHTVNQIDANIGLINANKLLTDEQRNNEVQKVIGTKLDNGLKGINYDVQKSIKDFLVQDAENRAVIGMWNAIDARKHPMSTGNERGLRDILQFDFFDTFGQRSRNVYDIHNAFNLKP